MDKAKICRNPFGFQKFLTMSEAIFAEKTRTYSYENMFLCFPA